MLGSNNHRRSPSRRRELCKYEIRVCVYSCYLGRRFHQFVRGENHKSKKVAEKSKRVDASDEVCSFFRNEGKERGNGKSEKLAFEIWTREKEQIDRGFGRVRFNSIIVQGAADMSSESWDLDIV